MTAKNPAARPTAEKLLKLPVFAMCEKKKKKTGLMLAGRRNSYSIGLNSSANFFLSKSVTFDNSNDDEDNDIGDGVAKKEADEKNSIPLMDVHCFRSVAVHPSIQRIGIHRPIPKKI